MKRKVGYWIVIGLFSLAMTGSALGYLSASPQMANGFRHLGYPDYFRTMLGVAKLLGVLALLVPRVPIPVREWAYAGFGITLIAAAVSHRASGDPIGNVMAPLIALALLIAARALWPEPLRKTVQ
jgi:hypothetical protein